METPSDPLDDYDIISSDLSSSSKVNGRHGDGVTIEIKTPEFDVLKEQPRYVISKGKRFLWFLLI